MMLKKYRTIFTILLFLQISFITAQNEKLPLEITGFVRSYSSVLLKNSDFNNLENTLDIKLEHQRENLSFFANPFVYQYPNKDNYYGFRELYIEYNSDKIALKIGKQQIIWGQADGVFITDVVSPKNLTNFLLWDFNEIRIGVNALKITYFPTISSTFEIVLMPTFSPTITPEKESIWRPKSTYKVEPIFDTSEKKVKENLKNSELFIRYSLSKSAIDLQLMAGYTWDDDASFHLKKQEKTLLIRPKYHRLGLLGGSFSTEINGFILRGEGAFYQNKYFQTNDQKVTDALTKKNYINYVIGLDRTLGDWKISGQFIQKIILNYQNTMQNDKHDNLATFIINKTLLREKLRVEFFSYIGLNKQDALLRLRGYYFPYDGTTIEIGTNLFIKNEKYITEKAGQFGQYDQNDMVYASLKYSF
ncbi:DUF1302 family protein [Tenacibaculum piscium]|uniref:DUF1302 family protein n=1 Tax=Tenacibaculum piscium TaxID=1458515 RepID=UPI001F25E5DA|nr:DUF1302 family protein [Tenacibaculum piscium]